MDTNGGCCVGSYTTRAHDTSKVDRIMLRFRPIAPKPVAGSTASRAFSPDGIDLFSRCGRGGGRRFVTVQDSYYANKNNNHDGDERCNRRRKHSLKQNFSDPAVTLPLLPETPDRKAFPAADLTPPAVRKKRNKAAETKPSRSRLNFEIRSPDRPPEMPAAGSFVTVESVMERWVDGGGGLGSTDEERRANLSKDTCPGFISDGYGRVTWTNKSFREMVGQEGKEAESDTVVWLVMKDKMVGMRNHHRSVTCRVKVQYTCRKESGSLTLPCDVWRMDSVWSKGTECCMIVPRRFICVRKAKHAIGKVLLYEKEGAFCVKLFRGENPRKSALLSPNSNLYPLKLRLMMPALLCFIPCTYSSLSAKL
ncbi:hypothetical protein G2W53_006679 [Senna tora]|uniref:DUF7950 domain-containing protein n=1 Tax=Senna tora TaxID=362788 RepID=A0A834X5M2_9FABA|nr:hypothetical protein G2W53_006679 [Senna tora]